MVIATRLIPFYRHVAFISFSNKSDDYWIIKPLFLQSLISTIINQNKSIFIVQPRAIVSDERIKNKRRNTNSFIGNT